MKVNFKQVFRNLEDNQIIYDDIGTNSNQNEKLVPFTLKIASIRALVSSYRNEPALSGEKKLEHYELARRIRDNDELDLSVEEISIIKDRIAKMWNGSLIPGQAWRMLDPKEKK